MNKISLLPRSVLGIGVIGAMLAACGGFQSGYGAMPQNAPGYFGSAVQPNTTCPVVGREYSTGKGHATVKFFAHKLAVGGNVDDFRARLLISKWPDKRDLPTWTTQLTTCGPQSGKKPIGKILSRLSPLFVYCHNGICDYGFEARIVYQSPLTLPNGKPWKYDEIVFKFKTPLKGWGALPSDRIEIVK